MTSGHQDESFSFSLFFSDPNLGGGPPPAVLLSGDETHQTNRRNRMYPIASIRGRPNSHPITSVRLEEYSWRRIPFGFKLNPTPKTKTKR